MVVEGNESVYYGDTAMGDAVCEQMEMMDVQMLELACRCARLGGWRLDRKTDTIILSPELCDLLRFSDPVTLILPYEEFSRRHVHPEDSWFVRDYQHTPPGNRYHFRVLCADGSERWLESFPAMETAPDATTVSGVVQDVTERIAGEDDLRNARKMESIRSIAGGIAHEFNNILYSIAGYVGLVKELVSDGSALDLNELNDYVSEIDISNRRAVQLIKKIQTFSHSGRKGITSVALDNVVAQVLAGISIPDNVTVNRLVLSDENMCVYANGETLRESLRNIIDNGMLAMADGGGTLTIELDRVFESDMRPVTCGTIRTGYYGRVAIGDEGCGMDSNTTARIFEPFFTTRQAGEGTGLGLAIVYGMVNAAGGAVEVLSQPQEGTVVRLYLPACSTMSGKRDNDDAHTGN